MCCSDPQRPDQETQSVKDKIIPVQVRGVQQLPKRFFAPQQLYGIVQMVPEREQTEPADLRVQKMRGHEMRDLREMLPGGGGDKRGEPPGIFPVILAGQLSPVCMDFGGDATRGYLELGFGMQGIVSLGIKKMF